jgi:hypothetical protein
MANPLVLKRVIDKGMGSTPDKPFLSFQSLKRHMSAAGFTTTVKPALLF